MPVTKTPSREVLTGVKCASLGEAILVGLDAEGLCELRRVLMRLEAHGQDDHVEGLVQELAGLVGIAEDEVARARLLADGRDHGALVLHAVLVLGALHVLVEVLAESPHLHIEDRGLDVLVVLLGDDRLLGGVHAADRRAPGIGIMIVAGADALDPGYLDRMLLVGGPLDNAFVRAGCGEDAFELDGGNHVRPAAEAQFGADLRVVAVEAGAEDDGADVQLELLGPCPRN